MTNMQDKPLRERKKEMLRSSILENAGRLFEARGYDNVTVAEIADASNISVKTLFTYFRSKDELVFQDSAFLDAVLAALAQRGEQTPARAIAAMLVGFAQRDGDVAEGILNYQRGYGESDALRLRILKLWAEFEDQVALALAAEAGRAAPTAGERFHAVQLVALVRSPTWTEVRALVATPPRGMTPAQAFAGWLEAAAASINYPRAFA